MVFCDQALLPTDGECSWIFNINASQALQGLWPTDSLLVIQFRLIPRITGCQSHTPFIFPSPLPSCSPFFVSFQCEGQHFKTATPDLLHIISAKYLLVSFHRKRSGESCFGGFCREKGVWHIVIQQVCDLVDHRKGLVLLCTCSYYKISSCCCCCGLGLNIGASSFHSVNIQQLKLVLRGQVA